MKKIILFLLIIILNIGCTDSKPIKKSTNKVSDSDEIIDEKLSISEILNFISNKKNNYSTLIDEIPKEVIYSYKKINNSPLIFNNPKTDNNSNFSCDDCESKKFQFSIYNDTFCLLVYKKFGLGSSDEIEYIKYKDDLFSYQLSTAGYLSDTILLRNFLISQLQRIHIPRNPQHHK